MNRRTTGRGAPRREGGIRTVKMQELQRDQDIARNRPAGDGLLWKRIDMHLHTPASSDYRDPGISYLDILKKAEEKNLDLIAFTDHNTVAGYAAMHREVETLTLLERLGRATDEERTTLSEYRRLLAKITVLPGFEFTATFGFHILGIFPENMSVRKLEYLLLNLNVPEEKMLLGAPDAGATDDVLAAYSAITTAGGLAIAAHANSSNGVAMQGFPFGGQTKIAYTQDPNLVALEVTDLEGSGRRNTASFYNGSKPEYPRRMHIIQGSDAHSLNTEQLDGMNKRLGVGARITEILVKEASFAALKELFASNDFTRTRPYQQGSGWEDIERARLEGQNYTQSFHERPFTHTSRARPILHDIVAFSNGDGGTIYVGANPDKSVPIHGIERPDEAIRMLKEDLKRTIEPPVEPEFVARGTQERGIITITVPKGDDAPYAFTPTGQVYIRLDAESVVANRDEIVTLVLEASRNGMARVSKPSTDAAQAPAAPRPGQITHPVDAGEPMAPQASGLGEKAIIMPTEHQAQARPQKQESRREERRTPAAQSTPPARQMPQQTPAPPDRTARPPIFANLPPEKLKGQVRPMAPAGGLVQQSVDGESVELQMLTPPSMESVEKAAPLELPAVVDHAALELVPAPAEAEKPKPRSRRGRAGSASTAETAPVAEEKVSPAPVEAAPEVEATPAKPARSRGKRKAAEPVPEAAAQMAVEDEPGTPMEMTVSSEHLTREELVQAEPDQPSTGKGRSRRRSKKLEVEAPTAAASESEAGEVAILVEAELEPGAQLPIELADPDAEVELTSPAAAPAKRGRSRRATEAQEAAEANASVDLKNQAQAEAAAEVAPAQVAEAPKRGRSRSKATKPDEQPAVVEAAKGAADEGQARSAPVAPAATSSAARNPPAGGPASPTTGVEIISTEEKGKVLYHTMRDLRNPSSVVHNVTRKSARRLWLYAITQHEHGDPSAAELAWHPTAQVGLWRREHRAGASRYDLVARYPDGSMRIFYGVTDEGLAGPWRELVQMAENADYWGPPPVEK
jgi:hypothetical protein